MPECVSDKRVRSWLPSSRNQLPFDLVICMFTIWQYNTLANVIIHVTNRRRVENVFQINFGVSRFLPSSCTMLLCVYLRTVDVDMSKRHINRYNIITYIILSATISYCWNNNNNIMQYHYYVTSTVLQVEKKTKKRKNIYFVFNEIFCA